MRRSIFITLLLVSLCHTASSEPKLNEDTLTKIKQQNATVEEDKIGTHESQPNNTQKVDAEKAKQVVTIDTTTNSQIVSNNTDVSTTNSSSALIPNTVNATSVTDFHPITTQASTNSSETTSPTTKSTITPAPATTDKSTIPPTPTSTNKPTTPDPASKTTTLAPTVKPTTDVPPVTPALPSTNAPIVTTTATPTKGRTFDGASFLGGMILSFGMVAIGILGFRYYKSHSEQNYHTL